MRTGKCIFKNCNFMEMHEDAQTWKRIRMRRKVGALGGLSFHSNKLYIPLALPIRRLFMILNDRIRND